MLKGHFLWTINPPAGYRVYYFDINIMSPLQSLSVSRNVVYLVRPLLFIIYVNESAAQLYYYICR